METNNPALDEYGKQLRMSGRADSGYKPRVTSQEHLRAAQKAKAAGDLEAYDMIMQSAREAATAEDQKAFNPTNGMGTAERVQAGYGRAVANIGRHAGNLVGLVPDADIQEAKQLDAPLMATEAGRTGNMLGETVTTSPIGAGLTGATARIAEPVAQALTNPIVRGAYEGAGQGALMADPGQRLEGAVTGSVAGGALPAAALGAKKAVFGMTRTPEADMLLSKGVELTPGQANPKGMYAQFEEATQSAPFVGGAVKAAREHGEQSFVKAGIREAAAPGAKIPDGPPDVMLTKAYESFQPLYDQAKGVALKLTDRSGKGVKEQLGEKLRQVVSAKGPTAAVKEETTNWLENEFSREMKKSDDLLKFRSEVRARIRDYAQQEGVAAKDARKILQNAEQAITESLEKQLPPDSLKALRTADAHYGIYKTFEDAVYKAKDRPQGFTPTQLSTAARDATDPAAYARGAGGLPRDMAKAGQRTLEMRVPPTGARMVPLALAIPSGGASIAIPAVLSGTKLGSRLALGQTAAQKKLGQIGSASVKGLTAEQKRLLSDSIRRANTTRVLQNSQEMER